MDEISQQHQQLSESLAAHVQDTKATFHDIEVEKQQNQEKNKAIQLENRSLKKELRVKYVERKFFWWRFLTFCLIPVLLLIITFYLLIFFIPNWQYNYSHQLMIWIDSLPKDSMEREILKDWIVNILSLRSIGIIGNIIRIRLFDSTKKTQKITSIKATMPSKYQ